MGGWDGALFFFGKISQTLSLCGLLWGAGVDSPHPGSGNQVDGGQFPVAGDADGGGVCGATHVGGWARDGNLLLGLFEEDCRSFAVRWAAASWRFGQ